MAVPGGWITTVCSECWQIIQNVRICGSIAFTHTTVGRRDPWLGVVMFVPAAMALSTTDRELGGAVRKKAL